MKKDLASARLSFDGCGFNDANNEYRERVATLSSYGKELPKAYHDRIVRAVNNFDALLEACKEAYPELNQLAFLQGDKLASVTLNKLQQAIANAEK